MKIPYTEVFSVLNTVHWTELSVGQKEIKSKRGVDDVFKTLEIFALFCKRGYRGSMP